MLTIKSNLSHEYVCCLPREIESTIKEELKKEIDTLALTSDEKELALENGLNSKVCDLTDTIEIEFTK